MNREEFDIWQKGIYETINEASINGLSQIKGDVGTHNNRTPEQIKANNEKQASLRAKAVEKMKSAASKAGEAIKNGAKAVAQKTGEVVNKAKNTLAGRDDRPIGLSSLNKKPNTDSNSAHKPTPNGAGVNKGNASSTASKFAKGVQNAQANPAPQPKATANTKSKKGEDKQLSFLTSTGRISKKYIPPENRESKTDDNKAKTTANTQPKTSKKPNAPQLKTDDNKTVTDTVLKHVKGEGGEKKSLGQKLKDTAKKAIKGANDLKWKAQDAKNFVKDTWNSRDAANKRARGIKADTKTEENKGESKENLNKKNNNPQQSNNNRTTSSNSNGSSTVHVHVTNHNDEHAKKNAQAKADAEKDREEFFKRVNSKTKGGETKAESGEETKTETNAPAEEKKESKAKKLSKNTPKTIGKKGGEKPEANAEGNKEEKTNLKSKAKETKQLSFLTKSGKIAKKYIQRDNEGSKLETKTDNKPEVKADTKAETKTDTKTDLKSKAKEAKQLSFLTKSGKISKKYIQKGNEGSKPEAKGDNQAPAEENKDNKNGKPNATDSNKPAVETGDKNTNQGKGKGATNSKNTNKGKGETNKGKGEINKGEGNKGGSKLATETETSTPAEENKDNNKPAVETGDKKTSQGKGETNKGKGEINKGEGETNNQNTNKNIPNQIKNIPLEQQAHGRDLSKEPATNNLPSGAAAGSNSLQHLKTKGEEPSMYEDGKGNPVPSTPAKQNAQDEANGKNDVGKRTPDRIYIKKKGTGETIEVTNKNTADGNKPDDNESDGNESDLKSKAKNAKRKGRIDLVGGVRRAQERRQAESEKNKNESTTATSGENSSTSAETDKNKNQATSTAVTGGKNTNPPADNDDDKNKNNNTANTGKKGNKSTSKKELTDEEKAARAKKHQEILLKMGEESRRKYQERKNATANQKGGHEDTRTAEQREKDNKEIIKNASNANDVKGRYQLSSLDGSTDPETGRQDGKPVDKEKFYKTLADQNKKIDSETEDEKSKRNSGITRASNNASGKKDDAEKAKKKEQEEKNRTSSFIDSVLNGDDEEESSAAKVRKIEKSINKYLGKNKK